MVIRIVVVSPNGTERWEMDRMGKLTLSALAVAMLLACALFTCPVDAAETESTVTDISEQLDAPKIGMDKANTEAEVEKWVKETWLTGVDWTKITVNETPLAADYHENLSIKKVEFKAAVAGTPDNKNGTEGLYKFTITDSTGKITATVGCKITTVFDYKSIECSVLMEDRNTEAEITTWLNTTWIPKFKTATGTDGTLKAVKSEGTEFKAAVAGTASDRAGKNGSMTFDVVKTEGTENTTVVGKLTCTVTAYSYGQIESSDKTVIFEGGKVSGLTVSSKDHTLTLKELEMIVAGLGGKDATLVPSITKADMSVYRNPLVIGEGDNAKTYRNGDVVKIDGRTCVLLIGDKEFSAYEIGTSHWVKYDRETFDESFREDEGQYTCRNTGTLMNINGVAYYLGYLLEDPSTIVISEKTYIGFIYDMNGKAAGYLTFAGSDIGSASKVSFVFNENMEPSAIEGGRAVAGTYTDADGKASLLYVLASKDVSVLRNGQAYAADGTLIIPVGTINDANNAGLYSLGTEEITMGTIKSDDGKNKATCPSNTASPLVVAEHALWNVEVTVGTFEFPQEPSDSKKSNTTAYIAVAAVLILLIGGGFYYFRYMKP